MFVTQIKDNILLNTSITIHIDFNNDNHCQNIFELENLIKYYKQGKFSQKGKKVFLQHSSDIQEACKTNDETVKPKNDGCILQ